jgi:hypothetical protein
MEFQTKTSHTGEASVKRLARFAGYPCINMNKIRSNNHIGIQEMDLQDSFYTEIQFWTEMLDNQTEQTPPEVLERMRMAKLLAEQKLSLYSTECDERIN